MSRLPAERSLSNILPSGAEGGKEFARIVDLLLFFDARKRNINLTLFSDRSGDTFGLDAFEGRESGYQYKFFPSPLSDNHRSEIVKSLQAAIEGSKKSNIKKWVLVTPDDLVNSNRKKDGGDVEWFGRLKDQHGAEFDIEHLGHTKLQALFLQSEHLSLHYYPDIIPDGIKRRTALQNVRKQYDDNLLRHFGWIRFVGMSVRKEEAARGLPMETIYIPLETVAEGTTDEDDRAPRTNPLEFLKPGLRTVLLGDPGTGKSTLLQFLALSGISQQIQERYKAQKHDRLALQVTLRRYADALKSNRNIPLIDYIVATVRADFSIPDFNADFILHHLQTGRVILLFDGVDELPDLSFKTLVRERVESMATSFPGNTVIVTSRIAGYEAEARFSGYCAFDHRQMAPLRDREIRRFAEDWHAARTEDEKDRRRQVAELMRILTDPESQPIRELARNPLLLTIMVLVHRVDAMLPDERVVLYQKCVETLMVSWHARKSEGEGRRGSQDRADQRRLCRLAAIAQWMHEQAGSKGAERRAVARKSDLILMLRDHIETVEGWAGSQEDAEDEADSFLNFVRERAGLLIEAGADLYSFVHLTFQEYLTALNIIIQSESSGDGFIWEKLEPLITNPRWREVVRLLVAERKSEKSKRNLIDKILCEGKIVQSSIDKAAIAALLGGLLIDRIPAAKERAADILEVMLVAIAICADNEASSSSILLTQLATLFHRDENAAAPFEVAVNQGLKQAGSDKMMRAGVVLAAFTVPLDATLVRTLMLTLKQDDEEAAALAEALLWGDPKVGPSGGGALANVYRAMMSYAMTSQETNLLASAIAVSLPGNNHRLLAGMMIMASLWGLIEDFGGPYYDLASNITSIHVSPLFGLEGRLDWRDNNVPDNRLRARIRDQNRARDKGLRMQWHQVLSRIGDRLLDARRGPDIKPDRFPNANLYRFLGRRHKQGNSIWAALNDERDLQDIVIEAVLSPMGIPRAAIWREALRRHFLPNLQTRQNVFRPETLDRTSNDLESGGNDGTAVDLAACWLLLDAVVDFSSLKEFNAQSSLAHLISVSEKIDHPILGFVKAVCRVRSDDEIFVQAVLEGVNHAPVALEEFLTQAYLIAPHPKPSKSRNGFKRLL